MRLVAPGPDGASGGTLIGRVRPPDHWDGWQRTEAGWWVDTARPDPLALLRMRQPRLCRQVHIDPDCVLPVPVLLEYGQLTVIDELVHTQLILDENGRPRLHRVIEHQDLAERLRNWVMAVDDGHIDELTTYRLAADLLAVCSHVCLYDLAAWKWLTDSSAVDVLLAAVSDPIQVVEDGD